MGFEKYKPAYFFVDLISAKFQSEKVRIELTTQFIL